MSGVPASAAAIELANVSKVFGRKVRALDGVSFTLQQGDNIDDRDGRNQIDYEYNAINNAPSTFNPSAQRLNNCGT